MTQKNRERARKTSSAKLDEQVSYQLPESPVSETENDTPEDDDTAEGEDKPRRGAKSTVVKETPWGMVRQSTFSITIPSDKKGEKPLYENKAEKFEYDAVTGLANVFVHSGAKLNEAQIDLLNNAFKDTQDKENDKLLGETVAELVTLYNDRQKSNAKGKAYAALLNKHKPLEGEKRDTAVARMINMVIKLQGISAEVAIANLKKIGSLPEDYTVSDYTSTPLRGRGKSAEGDEEDNDE